MSKINIIFTTCVDGTPAARVLSYCSLAELELAVAGLKELFEYRTKTRSKEPETHNFVYTESTS